MRGTMGWGQDHEGGGVKIKTWVAAAQREAREICRYIWGRGDDRERGGGETAEKEAGGDSREGGGGDGRETDTTESL